jgi:rhamnosyltransferase
VLASIVIPHCNEEQRIAQLLEGIGHQSLKDLEIILVESGSTDRILEIAPLRLTSVAYPTGGFHTWIFFISGD